MKPILTILLLAISTSIVAQRPFITKWDTSKGGSTANNQISIPINSSLGFTYNYSVDWGDGTVDHNQTGTATHNYTTPDIYTVSITGNFPHIFMPGGTPNKLLDIVQWGDISWKSLEQSFEECRNLTITATDAPDLSDVTSMRRMFKSATSFNQPISHWDVSNVTDMSQMFSFAENFNQNINAWNVSNVENMSQMFNAAIQFNQSLNNWNVEKVTDMSQMFEFALMFNQPIGNWKTNSLTTCFRMFESARAFNQPIGDWNMSQCKSLNLMFKNALAFNQDISNWDVSNVESMDQVFWKATNFNQDISTWDVSSTIVMPGMFLDASSFNQDISRWDVSNVTDMRSMFNGSAFNYALGAWNLSSVRNIEGLFTNSAISNINYDLSLIGWANNPNTAKNLLFEADGLVYHDSEIARDKLITDFNWTFNGDIKGVKVTFKDHDSSLLKEEVIKSGEDATPPVEPIRAGYIFTGWDKGFTNINASISITAQYLAVGPETFTVTFVDWDDNVLKTEMVLKNANATPPTIPSREGHTFNGWDMSYKFVTSNLTIKALYTIETYSILFLDHDFSLLKNEIVEHGSDATPPTSPTRDGYTFTGWDKNYTNIIKSIVLIAQYTEALLSVDEKEDIAVALYPNPANNIINISMGSHAISEKVTISIYNSLGAKVYQYRYSNGIGANTKHAVDISHLTQGGYYVNINSKTYKIVKQ